MTEHVCEFCKKVPVAETNMICDKCFEDEIKAQKQQDEINDYYNEQYRKRYHKTAVLDNEVGKITVIHYHKVIQSWNYNIFGFISEDARHKNKIEAKAYLEGWLDCMESVRVAIKRELKK